MPAGQIKLKWQSARSIPPKNPERAVDQSSVVENAPRKRFRLLPQVQILETQMSFELLINDYVIIFRYIL